MIRRIMMEKINWRKGLRFMYWTFYQQNGISWLESNKGDYLKVHDYDHALELMKNQEKFGWKYKLIL